MATKSSEYRHDYYMRRKANGGKPLREATNNYTTQVDVGNGMIIHLDKPLQYGTVDPAMKNAWKSVQSEIERFEKNYYMNDTESALLITDTANDWFVIGGDKGSVHFDPDDFDGKWALSHNHPAGRRIGGTFSHFDINTFTNNPLQLMRATTAEGTYSISKTSSFQSKEFKRAFNSEFNDEWGKQKLEMKKKDAELYTKYVIGQMSYEEAENDHYKAFNSYLVDMHNWLSDNQKKYGYNYSLERRQK